jgi:alpha-D-ribose 1-methylphosphonate 5-triphosphate synthase subunit PhnL
LHDGRWIDLATSAPRTIIDVRRRTIGHVSQFLRAIPRVPTITIVSDPLRANAIAPDEARSRAEAILDRLRIPERLWPLSPLTFSGGEQQRVNIATCFVADYPILLLDEPTASLDDRNRDIVAELIQEAKGRGSAIVGAFHDKEIRDAVCTGAFDISGSSKPPP